MSQLGSIQRKTRSLLDDLSRARRTWADLNSDSFAIANSLVNARLQQRYVDHPSHWHPSLDAFRDLRERYEQKMALKVAELAGSLVGVVNKMAAQHVKMENLMSQLDTLADRARETFGNDFVEGRPLFQTCPLSRFVTNAHAIHLTYTAELITKRALSSTSGLAAVPGREEAMVMLSVWLNQPSLDEERVAEFDDLCGVEMGAE